MAAPLAAVDWRRRRAEHERRVDELVDAHLSRRRDGVRHPVADFLFSYYSFRPAQLRRWHPGAGVVLLDADPPGPEYVAVPGGATLDTARLLARRTPVVAAIHDLLAATADRVPQWGCFGLHEWAMVYRQRVEETRHRGWPLRLDPAPVVEQQGLRCTHFDAFRFFTTQARPLNLVQLTRSDQPAYEQPACLHANMDLYKWAYKLSPLIPGELVLACFELARDIRTVDMRASPYDLTALGLSPVRVETSGGRAEYTRLQREFAQRAVPLRQRLVDECDHLLGSQASRPQRPADSSASGEWSIANHE
jgi:hypothetical protein